HGDYKEVQAGKKTYYAETIIIRTGAQYKKLGVPDEHELAGRGGSCAGVCDCAFFNEKELVVIAGGDSAVEDGLYLTCLAKKVTVIHRRDELRAQKIIEDRAFANDKMEFIWDTVVETINEENGKTGSVTMKNVKTGEKSEFKTDGVFIYIGMVP